MMIMEDKLDYEDIFPKCTKDFYNAENTSLIETNNKYENMCQLIFYRIGVNSNMKSSFINKCSALTHFLHNISNSSLTYNNGKYCTCFNYQLKHVLRQYNCDYQDTKTAYERMTEVYYLNGLTNLNICSGLNNHLNDYSFFNLIFLEFLNYYLEMYDHDGGRTFKCPSNSSDYKRYLIFLKKCEKSNSNNFCKTISNLKERNSNYMMRLSECIEVAESLAVTSKSNTTRFAVATFIVLCTILITVFIFYRFNFIGLYLQRTARKIRSHMNNKHKDNYISNDIFEMEYKGLIQDEYKVAYTTENEETYFHKY
ncbi:variable surface protein [Plasmodium gonderi]|uniref:Variable surface protein n=1 Tax=Plasmodium gonderi TaxID=77519 RepID=A0A1Y1JRS0_PLAGO|nr:variable surface protein [Plasmodium gonderi]GAW84158.1 variable surface protein [Plasmodium gonderi]